MDITATLSRFASIYALAPVIARKITKKTINRGSRKVAGAKASYGSAGKTAKQSTDRSIRQARGTGKPDGRSDTKSNNKSYTKRTPR